MVFQFLKVIFLHNEYQIIILPEMVNCGAPLFRTLPHFILSCYVVLFRFLPGIIHNLFEISGMNTDLKKRIIFIDAFFFNKYASNHGASLHHLCQMGNYYTESRLLPA